MDFAIQHCYERASIVTDKELLRHALRFGVGDVDVEQIKRQLLRDELIKENVDGRQWLTTKDVLAEEKRLIDFVAGWKREIQAVRFGQIPVSKIQNFPMSNATPSCTSCKARSASRPFAAGLARARRR